MYGYYGKKTWVETGKKTWVRNFNDNYNPTTVRRAGIACPKGSKNIPYAFSSVMMHDECAGVRKEHPGVAIMRLRKERHISRQTFARIATNEGSQFAAYVTASDIQHYEYGICCPKMDKFTAIKLAIMKIANMSEREAERYLAGYSEATTMRTQFTGASYSSLLKNIKNA